MVSARSRCAFSGPNWFSSYFSSSRSALEASQSMSKSACSLSLSSTEKSSALGYTLWNIKASIVLREKALG